MDEYEVVVDGERRTLRFDSWSGNRGFQYLTEDNRESHAFALPLNQLLQCAFHTNGHRYEVVRKKVTP